MISEGVAGLPGDTNGDGVVDFVDFINFASGFGHSNTESGFDPLLDLNADGVVNFPDFLAFVAVFGR